MNLKNSVIVHWENISLQQSLKYQI